MLLAPRTPNSHLMNITRPFGDTLALIGNTPIVRLAGPSAAAGCDIYGKGEFANPGSSVKERRRASAPQARREASGYRPSCAR